MSPASVPPSHPPNLSHQPPSAFPLGHSVRWNAFVTAWGNIVLTIHTLSYINVNITEWAGKMVI